MEIEIEIEEAGVILKLLKESLNPLVIIEPKVVSDGDVEGVVGKIEGAIRAKKIWNLLVEKK